MAVVGHRAAFPLAALAHSTQQTAQRGTLHTFGPRNPSSGEALSGRLSHPPHSGLKLKITSPRPRCTTRDAVTATDAASFNFSDHGSEVEVRVQLPAGLLSLGRSKNKVLVHSTADSLTIKLSAQGTTHQLLKAQPLFSTISPKDTTWHWDAGELVVVLQKDSGKGGAAGASSPWQWPGLVQDWQSLCQALQASLKGCSIFLAGTCSSRVKWDVAQELARGLGYTPLASDLLLAQITGTPVSSLLEAEGMESVARAEADILQSLATNARVVVASMTPFPAAPAMERSTGDRRWRYLFSGLLIWIDLQDEGVSPGPLEQPVDAAIRVGLSEAEWKAQSGSVRATAEAVVKASRAVLASEPLLPGKKSLYVRLGCRGDWPDLMPPGWTPSDGDQSTAVN